MCRNLRGNTTHIPNNPAKAPAAMMISISLSPVLFLGYYFRSRVLHEFFNVVKSLLHNSLFEESENRQPPACYSGRLLVPTVVSRPQRAGASRLPIPRTLPRGCRPAGRARRCPFQPVSSSGVARTPIVVFSTRNMANPVTRAQASTTPMLISCDTICLPASAQTSKSDPNPTGPHTPLLPLAKIPTASRPQSPAVPCTEMALTGSSIFRNRSMATTEPIITGAATAPITTADQGST